MKPFLVTAAALIFSLTACDERISSRAQERVRGVHVDAAHHEEHDDLGEHSDQVHIEQVQQHESPTVIRFDPEAERLAGLTVARAITGVIDREITLPGEIGFNEDRLAHVSPRFEGIVREVSAYLGSDVVEGEELALIESNVSLNVYTVAAPISGTIVEKHITPGEFVSQDFRIFTIADLETVWVNLEAPAQYVGMLSESDEILIQSLGDTREALGKVWYVAPILRETTRGGLVRVALPNQLGHWWPGAFVTGKIKLARTSETVLVLKDAVQVMGEKRVVFVPLGEGRYQVVQIEIGLTDRHHTQVLAGLKAGESYVSAGAFELKAQTVLSSLGGHAGHGH